MYLFSIFHRNSILNKQNRRLYNMKTLQFILIISLCFLTTSCHIEEKNNIEKLLSHTTSYLYDINKDSPYSVMNQGNFAWLCEIGGWQQNLESAQFMYANGSYNTLNIAIADVKDAIIQASIIGDSELIAALQSINTNLEYSKENAFGAKENYNNTKYGKYIGNMINSNNSVLEKIENCRKLLDK